MYKTILHATDLKQNHYDLCNKSVQLAKNFKASLYFIHVIEIPTSLQWAQSLGFAELATPSKEGAQMVMTTLKEAFNLPSSNFYIEIGSPYLHILELVKQLKCDLIILG